MAIYYMCQVLVYHMLQSWISGSIEHSCLDRECLQSVEAYMKANAECMR